MFPPAYVADESGKPMHSWRVLLLPFLDQPDLYAQYDFAEAWDGPNNRQLWSRIPRIFQFPNFHELPDGNHGITNYLAITGDNTAWPGSSSLDYDNIPDGPGNTILAVENLGSNIRWTEPRDLEFDSVDLRPMIGAANGISSAYNVAAIVALDGTVRSVPNNTDSKLVRALVTPAGGETTKHGQEDVLVTMDDLPKLADGRTRGSLHPALRRWHIHDAGTEGCLALGCCFLTVIIGRYFRRQKSVPWARNFLLTAVFCCAIIFVLPWPVYRIAAVGLLMVGVSFVGSARAPKDSNSNARVRNVDSAGSMQNLGDC